MLHGIADYSDMREDILHMIDTAEEYRCLELFVTWIEGEGKALTSEDYADNIDAQINYFEKGFAELSSDIDLQQKFEKQFTNFFIMLQKSEGLTLTKEQLARLNQLVELFFETFGISSLPYRRTLLSIPEKNMS